MVIKLSFLLKTEKIRPSETEPFVKTMIGKKCFKSLFQSKIQHSYYDRGLTGPQCKPSVGSLGEDFVLEQFQSMSRTALSSRAPESFPLSLYSMCRPLLDL